MNPDPMSFKTWHPNPLDPQPSSPPVTGRFYTCNKHGWDALGVACPECKAGYAPTICHKHGWNHADKGCPDCTTGKLRLVRVDHDNMENRSPISEKEIGVFTSVGTQSAYAMASRWFSSQEPIKLYLGYDGKVYPQWKLVATPILDDWTPTVEQINSHRASDHCGGVITPESDEQVISRLQSERRSGRKTFAWQTTSGADL